MSYTPPKEVLEKYAKLLVNFALGGGTGIKPGEAVYLQSSISALPFYRALRKIIIDSGGHTLNSLSDDMSGAERYFYEHASDEQLTYFPNKFLKGLVDQVDHRIAILSEYDLHELDKVDPKKIIKSHKAMKPVSDWFRAKENEGKHTWTLALYGTPSLAKEAGLSEKAYWDQIISACYLDKEDPIKEWKKIFSETQGVAKKLTDLQIDKVHIQGSDANLVIKIGEKRKWVGGDGRNIPSYEVFTSPDWRGTEGWIRFNQPLYYFGPKIEDVKLTFKAGKVVKASATKNEKLLKSVLSTDKTSDQIGEFSLTDHKLSRITHFMADTLFDENRGGQFGNTHIAVGRSYEDTFDGDPSKLSKKQFIDLGYNDSAIHVDIVSTSDRTVTATLTDGTRLIIYKDGQFTI